MAPSIDDPSTWPEYASLDAELQRMMDDGVQPRFTSDDMLSSLPDTRKRWNSIFMEDTEAALKANTDTVVSQEVFIQGRDGQQIRNVVYRPKELEAGGAPVAIFIHGGGFILGLADMEGPPCVAAARDFGCICISIDYRLSPEVKFPVAYEECWDVITWVSKNASQLGGNLSKGFILAGTSAGGHIGIPLSHRARDEGLTPGFTGIYLGVPPALMPEELTDKYRHFYKSREQMSNGLSLTSEAINLYDMAVEPDHSSPLWNPLLWPTGHANLPPTFFQICGADMLRDEALIYERELRLEHGVQTMAIVYEGMPHVFWYTYPGHPEAKRYVENTSRGVGWLLGRYEF